MDFRQAGKIIKKGKIAPLYLFSGPEDYLKEELLGEILQVLKKDGRSFDLERKDGLRLSLTDLLDSVKQGTIFTGGRVYWISDPPYLTASPQKAVSSKEGKKGKKSPSVKSAEKELLSLLGKKDPDFLFIFTVEKADRRKKIVKAIEKAGLLIEFPLLRGKSLSSWIKNELLLQEKQVEEDALFELIERVGEDLRRLKSELDKIVTYMGKEKTVTRSLVSYLIPDSNEDSIFNLVEAVGNKNMQEAFFHLTKMRRQNEHPLKILAMIIRQYRLLYQILPMRQAKISPRKMASLLRVQPFVVGELIKQLEKYNQESLARVLFLLKEIDRDIKTGRREGDEALEQLILKLSLMPE
ncbi:MAG TPA: DNA polymerase III subunit delta [Firmicutes bacterium]|jgi:DNA polymerase-3 subunit delta|nr:DNA polymerase III subunit delta [Bacillota bacterium]